MTNILSGSLIVCLSHKINSKGELSMDYKKRIEKSLNLLEQNSYNFLLLTGGVIGKIADECYSRLAHSYIKKKYPTTNLRKIYHDDFSLDTVGELIYSKEYFSNNDFENITIISSDWHLERVKKIAKKVFGTNETMLFLSINGSAAEKETEERNTSLNEFQSWSKWCDDGDHTCLKAKLFLHHKLYKI